MSLDDKCFNEVSRKFENPILSEANVPLKTWRTYFCSFLLLFRKYSTHHQSY